MEWREVALFWFEECTPEQWWKKDEALDAKIKERFGDVYWQVVRGETDHWREEPEGRLAEIIVLDQFARNIFRGTPQAFLYDPLALALAQEMVRRGDDQKLPKEKRHFVYMPYMHSESPKVHEAAMELFESIGETKYEVMHKEIIDRFGRYPHRNAIVGRESTPEELEFLKEHEGF